MSPVNLFKKYETDASLETGGVEINIEGAIFICRRAGGNNRRYKFAIADASAKRQEKLKSTDPDILAKLEDEVVLEAYAESVVIGWRNVSDREGNEWPFSKENFLELMAACPDVWLRLRLEARDIEVFRAAQVQEAGETVGKFSSGTSSGENTSSG